MRSRALVVAALLALPCGLTAQVLRLPRRGGTPEPAPLPPAAEPVARALSIARARWSVEGYSLISSFQVPNGNNSLSRVTTFGNGTHADYRYTDHLSASIDLTASYLGAISQTAEVGTRYSPLDWNHTVRPFFDVRGGYMMLSDQYTGLSGVGAAQNVGEGTRYSRGFGGIGGAGAEYTISNEFAITTEILALRNRMTTYRLTSTASLPQGSTFMMTSYRLAIGLKYNPLRSMQMNQNPRQ